MADIIVTINFDLQNANPFSYSGQDVQSNGDMTVDLPQEGSVPIVFVLNSTVGTDAMAGIKISRNQEDLCSTGSNAAPPVAGGKYPDTPFFVTTTGQTLVLDDQDRQGLVDAGDWYYSLGVRHQNDSESWDDPKIHNQGDDGPVGQEYGNAPTLKFR